MYKMNIQVRYSETDPHGKVPLHQIMEYFQDSGVFQSIALGFSAAGDTEPGHAWYLLAWDVKVDRYPELGEKLTVVTEPYKMKGFYGYRRYWIQNEQGEMLAEADSIWVLMNVEQMVPIRIPKYIEEGYIEEGVDNKVRIKRKLSPDGDWQEKEVIEISKMFLDSNIHVNNTCYVLWAEDFVSEQEIVKRLRVDYRQSAFKGDTIHVFLCREGNILRIKYINQDDVINAIIEMELTKR